MHLYAERIACRSLQSNIHRLRRAWMMSLVYPRAASASATAGSSTARTSASKRVVPTVTSTVPPPGAAAAPLPRARVTGGGMRVLLPYNLTYGLGLARRVSGRRLVREAEILVIVQSGSLGAQVSWPGPCGCRAQGAGSAWEDAAGCYAVLATLRFSTSLLCGHCISCQLMGTICTPAQRTAHSKLPAYHSEAGRNFALSAHNWTFSCNHHTA